MPDGLITQDWLALDRIIDCIHLASMSTGPRTRYHNLYPCAHTLMSVISSLYLCLTFDSSECYPLNECALSENEENDNRQSNQS